MKVEHSLICLVGTRIPMKSMVEWQFVLALKILKEIIKQSVVIWNQVFKNWNNTKLNRFK